MDPNPPPKPIVAKLKDGTVVKGSLISFEPDRNLVLLQQACPASPTELPLDTLKAVYFVRSLQGDRRHHKTKAFTITNPPGMRLLVRFHDGEVLTGFLESPLPWPKGFHISKPDPHIPGFMLCPSDPEGNNERIYVVNSSVMELTRL